MRYIKLRYLTLGALLLIVWLAQVIPACGEVYASEVYPSIAYLLSGFSNLFPFAIGDIFIIFSIVGWLSYPFRARLRKPKEKWCTIVRVEVEFLLWIYVWFYLAWGLNYSQPNFFQRTGIHPVQYTEESFMAFAEEYIDSLNCSYTTKEHVDKEKVCEETVRIYHTLSNVLGIHQPPHTKPRAKAMIYTPLASKVGVTGSMGPFFCEFTLNGDTPDIEYPATYAHELSHLLGIANEAEANFYAYEVCTRSQVTSIRFSGYFSVLGHVLGNARRLLPQEKYKALFQRIDPEVIRLAQSVQEYWQSKYSPLIGEIQNRMYDLYLKGNKISSGRKNYSEVVELIIAYREHEKTNKQSHKNGLCYRTNIAKNCNFATVNNKIEDALQTRTNGSLRATARHPRRTEGEMSVGQKANQRKFAPEHDRGNL